jgi:hypothetical protein
METMFDKYIMSDPVQKALFDEGYRRLTIHELALGREFKKAGLEPTRLPTPEEIRNEDWPPEDSKEVDRKKLRIIRRVNRLMRNPDCRRRLWGDIADLPLEQLLRVEHAENKEWAVRP